MIKPLAKAAMCCCVLSLCACTADKALSVTQPDEKLDGCTLRFSWWGGDDRHEATLEAIELWNQIHPEIVISPEYGGWDGWTEKVSTQLSGDNAPDVMQINYDWLVNYSPDGKGFYDLYQLQSQLDLSGFDEETLSFGVVNERLNAVTVSMSGRGLFYNSEVYNTVGAEYPETWDELIALGSTFGEKDLYPIDLDNQSGATAWYISVVYTQQLTGREFITMDGKLGFSAEDIKTALDFYKTLEDNHVIRTVQTRTDEDGNCALYQSPEFISGKIAGVCEWGSAIGKYESVLSDGVLECGPYISDGSGNLSGWMIKPSLMYAVSDTCQYPDEAAAFLDFLLNNEQCAEILGTTRGIPASEHAVKALENSGLLEGPASDSTETLVSMDTVTISPYMELSRMKEFYNTAIEKVSYSTVSTADAAQEMYNSITQYLETLKK
ncbi:MAG: carbohydrate ABC transporter substrate-binding protein [Ruminococcus sp.]|nr:carbohydrate ABC transporter substrate-binding protein [Ruminococcus sp.]